MRLINDCTDSVLFKSGTILGTPVIVANKDIGYHFIIGKRGNIDRYWDISLYKPEYLFYSDSKMNDEEKNDLCNIINSNWKEIVSITNYLCSDNCGANNCIFNKKISIEAPDYKYL